MDEWIIQLEIAAESLMGIAGAIQHHETQGRQDQCYRTRNNLLIVLKEMKAAKHRESMSDGR